MTRSARSHPRRTSDRSALVDDLDVEQDRALALGATVEPHQPTEGVRVMRDPHGHAFCLFLPGA